MIQTCPKTSEAVWLHWMHRTHISTWKWRSNAKTRAKKNAQTWQHHMIESMRIDEERNEDRWRKTWNYMKRYEDNLRYMKINTAIFHSRFVPSKVILVVLLHCGHRWFLRQSREGGDRTDLIGLLRRPKAAPEVAHWEQLNLLGFQD